VIYVCQECEETFDISLPVRSNILPSPSCFKTIKFHFKWKFIETRYGVEVWANNFTGEVKAVEGATHGGKYFDMEINCMGKSVW
jgi:hypothetical protein